MSLENTSGRNVLAHYGPRSLDSGKYGADLGTKDRVMMAIWEFDFDDAPAWEDSRLLKAIPAGSFIKAARVEVLETATGLTDLDIVMEKASDGSNAEALVANMTETTGTHIAAGALVGSALTEDKTVDVAITGATAGKFRLVIEYTLEV